MGLRDFLDKVKQKVEDRHKEETDPAKIRAAKKAAAEKNFKRTTGVIKAAKKGLETYNDASKKVDGIKESVAETVGKIADKAKPIADKVDLAAGVAGGMASEAFKTVKDKVGQGVDAAGKKIQEVKKDNANNPSTGSGLLDFIAPAVPETDATSRKAKEEPKASPPKAAPPAPPAA